MMNDTLRTLLYPMGFGASLLFGIRFLVQWLHSEKKKESLVTHSFWHLSWIAHLLLGLHSLIQLQYPICLSQMWSGFISCRNLDLMGKKRFTLKSTIAMMVASGALLTLFFAFYSPGEWMRAPTLPWSNQKSASLSLFWHIMGFFGIFLFSSRAWVQWWCAEKKQASYLGTSYWLISCTGALFSLIYTVRLKDPVNMVGFSLGLIPYIRNLVLIQKKAKRQHA